jgi:hypothetical protein
VLTRGSPTVGSVVGGGAVVVGVGAVVGAEEVAGAEVGGGVDAVVAGADSPVGFVVGGGAVVVGGGAVVGAEEGAGADESELLQALSTKMTARAVRFTTALGRDPLVPRSRRVDRRG